MDIYKMLKENSDIILKEDLEFFEIELATGDYEREYINKCLELIKEIKQFKNIKEQKIEKVNIDDPYADISFVEEEPIVNLANVEKGTNDNDSEARKESLIKTLIVKARSLSSYQTEFIKIIKENNIQEEFVDKNYVFFKQIEMDELIKIIYFSEDFLEKYFKLLNLKLVAEYQLFSETFYMKHFSQLDYKIVLKKGKNPWVKKKQRSSKLTVFLKLKGITL